jgi:manganese/zinc/iron transport system ATP- binding protein
MGLIPTVSGVITVYGKSVASQRKRLAYVPQRESVDWNFPVNVQDVVMMGRYGNVGLFRRPGSRDKAIVTEALEAVGMQDYRKRQISQLSGGQQQRVFLARALAQHADIYIMDEPFSGVDAATEDAILKLLNSLKKNGKTVLLVHHDLQTVASYFDNVLLLNLRQVAFGPMGTAFTADNLHKTYGGRLNILSDVLELTRKQNLVREHGGS